MLVLLDNNKVNDGGKNQNIIIFIRRNAISGAPSIKGINGFRILQLEFGFKNK